jgi:hypothetical protein
MKEKCERIKYINKYEKNGVVNVVERVISNVNKYIEEIIEKDKKLYVII